MKTFSVGDKMDHHNQKSVRVERGNRLSSDFGFASFMKTAVSKRNHAGFRAVFKGESKTLTGIGDKYGIAALGVFRFDIFSFMDV